MNKNIEVGKHAGFCGGVNLCIKTLEEEINTSKRPIYCLGELVHNKEVVKRFKEKGVNFVNELNQVPDGAKLAIRAHGAERTTYDEAKLRNMEVLDLTCPKVAKIKEDVKEYINTESYIVLVAKKEHPEAKSTISFLGENASIVETKEEVESIIARLNGYKNIAIISQTTFDEKTFLGFAEYIKENISKNTNVIVKNTICNATSIRQEETRKMAKEKDVMIIIGGKNSSNTHELYDIAKSECAATYWIEAKEEVDLTWFKAKYNIGVMAGASTPKEIIDEVVAVINS